MKATVNASHILNDKHILRIYAGKISSHGCFILSSPGGAIYLAKIMAALSIQRCTLNQADSSFMLLV